MARIYYKAIMFFVVLFALLFLFKFNLVSFNLLSLPVDKNQPALLEEIKQEAPNYNEEAEDAYIDNVWKKTPGRNGRKVNIQKSYKNMKESEQFDKEKLVFDEIKPNVSLEQLPASPIYRGHPEKEMVTLLINVSWGTEHIPVMLETLKEHEVKANFFIEGQWAKENKSTLKMIDEQGHLIGNHGFNHPDMAKMTAQQIKEQITKTNDIIEAIIDKPVKWFAPPSGSFTDTVVKIADQEQMETILWTVDTIDWQKPSASVMINRVMDKVHPGATILMHPTPVVAEGLDRLLVDIKLQGYRVHTIEQLIQETR